jgi:thioredoxin-dependent peroxiredoxin
MDISMLSWFFTDPLPPGTPAPDFTLPDQRGQPVSLSKLRGKNVILVFYPGDDTSVCTKQLCSFRDQWPEASAKNAVIFGVNPQAAAKHTKFRDRYNFQFPLLVDEKQRVANLYKCSGLIVRRTVYLIGPDGTIRFSRRGNPPPAEVLKSAA